MMMMLSPPLPAPRFHLATTRGCETKIHARSVKLAMADDAFTTNDLLISYSRRGVLDYALNVFCPQRIPSRHRTWCFLLCFGERPDQVTYSAVLSAFQQAHDTRNMDSNPRMYSETWICIMSVCLNFNNQSNGILWFGSEFTESHSGWWQDRFGVVRSYHLSILEAWHDRKCTAVSSETDNVILYNTMLTVYANHGLIEEALSLYQEMANLQLAPTPATFVAVISGCSHLGLVEQGKLLFSSMLFEQGMNPTRANYACLIDLLVRKGLLQEAKGVIESMPFQLWPAVWRSLMNGCRIHQNKELGVLAAEHILRMMPCSDGAYVSLSNVYAEDGEWQSAEDTRRMAEYLSAEGARFQQRGDLTIPGRCT
ncbi:hypothetical protein PR202_ga04217 [Eleusine coracana subsp. coracana]|uniref:Pentatricopeptide repeat-containing protein n=1 Tax=Eleusine coracana subsp. coracana TaxID=191504 RepID=A0AAV5BQI4_ELECO|nr:hypothetical protein PR202_ga04217 [Eleusine coracana subsp. coracana]